MRRSVPITERVTRRLVVQHPQASVERFGILRHHLA